MLLSIKSITFKKYRMKQNLNRNNNILKMIVYFFKLKFCKYIFVLKILELIKHIIKIEKFKSYPKLTKAILPPIIQ